MFRCRLPFRFEDYFALVELTGRHFHPNKRGKIDDDASPGANQDSHFLCFELPLYTLTLIVCPIYPALNEYIARQANKEDGYTGHLREGRFKSQASLLREMLGVTVLYIF